MPVQELRAIASQTIYPLEAFLFVQRGLDYTVRQAHGELDETAGEEAREGRHVTGRDLCHGLREYAVQQYGLLARTVLRRWKISSSEDFGHIVFAMVDAGMMHKTDEDSMADFTGIYDFTEAFGGDLVLSESA